MLSRSELESAYLRLERPLYNYLYRWFWQPETCRDLIHDAFEKVWRVRHAVKVESVDALVWTTAINLGRNHHRRGKVLAWMPLPAVLMGGTGPDEEAQMLERDQRLRAALDRLPDRSREVLLLELFSGVPRAQLAAMLSIPMGTLASRKNTAISQLKEVLSDED